MTDDSRSKQLAELAFASSFQKSSIDEPSAEDPDRQTIEGLIARFEDGAHEDENGVRYWYARDLQKLLGYIEYRNFQPVILKAIEACKNSQQPVENHFVQVHEMVEIGSNAKRQVSDYKLTRYASYLIAQNGDSTKQPIAFAQTYFAIQTRRQEVQDESGNQYTPLSEEQKRLLLRDEIKTHNKNLASAAKGAGVISPLDFAVFQTFGYKGLYGGLDKSGIQRKKGLKPKDTPLDHMGSTELAANLFRATQTDEKLRREQTKGKNRANELHFEVGKRVRQTIRDLGGTMPENLPPAEDIEKVAKRLKKAAINRSLSSDSEPDVET
ncbi:MAG TPA: DNA damage-inducible protein D [Acidobacteriaceae bacterium]|nr:DNA damage-inducible protein D [Acidobacteriaceae bacterium]